MNYVQMKEFEKITEQYFERLDPVLQTDITVHSTVWQEILLNSKI